VNNEVIVSSAVTGGSEPVMHRLKTPKEIATAAIEAAGRAQPKCTCTFEIPRPVWAAAIWAPIAK